MLPILASFLIAAAHVAAPGAGPAAFQQAPNAAARTSPDSMYLQARDALNRGDFRRAASLFDRVANRAGDSEVAGDALYWRAYALYRVGGNRELREAQKALKAQKDRYPKAKTRGDADALATRIDGTLARQGDSGAAATIAERADDAAKADCPRGDDDDDLRVAALNALMQMDSERAVPVLAQVLERRDACSAPLRRKAVFILSQKRSPEVERLLLTAARSDPDREVREQAVSWLGQVRSEAAIVALDSILRNSDDRELREKAIFALSQNRDERALLALRRAAEDTVQPLAVREQAVFWLGQGRSAESATFLRELFGRTRSDDLREKIMFSLSQMRGQGNDQWLLGIARDANYSVNVRKQALFSAGQNRAPIADLAALYGTLDDLEVKKQLLWVLSDRREATALDKLIEVARTEQDVELRKTAIFWLGQSRDPRAQQLLLELINQE